ncbi:coxsackievirus and adenovirus receptor homolog [Dunckerocampus dactyliophorus]|uniref:coxsackievirus and adenovirus receptor homolog n=1 Tax=Dunckerocampus dactyliophorus TaxID=161453 RepID=UPI0024073AF8|nr:coxsackievirus and adenovirus receptor homolog [Dunckerocampus dactyliophorus]
MTSVLWSFFLVLAFCDINPAYENIKKYYYSTGTGSTVTLPCHYTLHHGHVEKIYWYLGPNMIKSYYRWNNFEKYNWQNRFDFTNANPDRGDASIEIRNVDVNDAGTYNCAVITDLEYSSERFIATVNLTVSREQSSAVCVVEGEPVVGNEVNLKCQSNGFWRSWTKVSRNQMSPHDTNEIPIEFHEWSLRITENSCGRYRCTTNEWDYEKGHTDHYCYVLLECPPSTTTASNVSARSDDGGDDGGDGVPVTAVAMTTVVLVLAVVCALAAIWYWFRRHSGELIIDDTMEVSSLWSREVEPLEKQDNSDRSDVNWDGPGLETLPCSHPPVSGDTALKSAK